MLEDWVGNWRQSCRSSLPRPLGDWSQKLHPPSCPVPIFFRAHFPLGTCTGLQLDFRKSSRAGRGLSVGSGWRTPHSPQVGETLARGRLHKASSVPPSLGEWEPVVISPSPGRFSLGASVSLRAASQNRKGLRASSYQAFSSLSMGKPSTAQNQRTTKPIPSLCLRGLLLPKVH